MRFKPFLRICATATLLVACLAPSASAGLMIRLTDITDGDSASSPSVTVGDTDGDDLVTYIGQVGAFSVNVATGIGPSILGDLEMDLNSVNVTGGSGGTIRLELTRDDLTFDGLSSAIRDFGVDVGGTTNGSVHVDFKVDENNELFGGPALTSFDFGTGAFADSGVAFTRPDGQFSATIEVIISHSSAGQVSSLDVNVQPLPEPGSLVVWSVIGLCVPGLILLKRSRKIKAAIA